MPIEHQVIQQAFKFAVTPTDRQMEKFIQQCGAARFCYNWGNRVIKDAHDAYREQKDAGQKPDVKIPGHFDLCAMWRTWKNTAEWTDRHTGETTTGVPWVDEHDSRLFLSSLRDVARAWKRFHDSRRGQMKGRRVGVPRFKSKSTARMSYTTFGSGLNVVDSHHIALPKVGAVKTHESTRKLLRKLRKPPTTCPECSGAGKVAAAGAGADTKKCPTCKGDCTLPIARIVRATVSRDSGRRWHVSLTVETVREVRTTPSQRQKDGGALGVDLGTRDLATFSNGDKVSRPRYLDAALRKLAKQQRAVSRRQKDSNRRAKAVRRVGKIHNRVRNLRADFTSKLATHLVQNHATIAVEGWDIQQTMHHGSTDIPKHIRRTRNRALADAGAGELRQLLERRAPWYGCTVTILAHNAATGRTCSSCGQERANPVPLTEEQFRCPACGWTGDRRVNAARNAVTLARQQQPTP